MLAAPSLFSWSSPIHYPGESGKGNIYFSRWRMKYKRTSITSMGKHYPTLATFANPSIFVGLYLWCICCTFSFFSFPFLLSSFPFLPLSPPPYSTAPASLLPPLKLISQADKGIYTVSNLGTIRHKSKFPSSSSYTDKKENQIFLIYQESQSLEQLQSHISGRVPNGNAEIFPHIWGGR